MVMGVRWKNKLNILMDNEACIFENIMKVCKRKPSAV